MEPIVCSLTPAQLTERRSTLLARFRACIEQTEFTDSSVRLRLGTSDEVLETVSEVIRLERQCCRFLHFTLTVSVTEVWLELSGPEGTRHFVEAELLQ